MNIKPVVILAACAFFTGGCNKSPTSSTANNNGSQPPPPIQAEAFHGQVYKSLDGGTVLTLVSKDECELNQGGTILLCKYTKPNDTLRVVTTALGTSQVIYFRFTAQGLVDNNGNVLFSPEGLTAKIQQQQLEQQRVADEKINSVRETQIIATFSLLPFFYYNPGYQDVNYGDIMSPNQLVLTDVSVKLQSSEGQNGFRMRIAPRTKVILFASLESVTDIEQNQFRLNFSENSNADMFEILQGNSEVETSTVHDAVLNAFNAWKAKFPKAVLR